MIAAQTTKVIESTIEGRSVDMSLDLDALAKLMKMYTDLYSDRILACIREISTNAFDAHVEAGNSAPFEVRLPTPIDPYFRVQDFGTGLSADEFIEVYSKYGKSTRSTSNEYAGMMGLGCKAPLTYTSQYTIYSVKDGIAYEVLITRNEIGTGKITVVSETPTDEPNGVLVEIMANEEDINGFRDRADRFFRFWDPSRVLVDGNPPKQIEGTKVGDDMLIIQDSHRRDYVVMGNVAYPVSQSGRWSVDHGLQNGHTLVTYVPLGAVSIPPAREGLSEDKHTQDELARISAAFKEKVVGSIQRDINTATSAYEAVNKLVKWQSILPKDDAPSFKDDYTFQGRTIPSKVMLPPGSIKVPNRPSTRRGGGGMKANDKAEAIGASSLGKRMIFTGWENASFTGTMRRKLDQWLDENALHNDSFDYILMRPGSFNDPWFDQSMVFDWADVKAIQLAPRESSGGGGYGTNWNAGRLKGSFDVVTEDGSQTEYPADDIDRDEPIYYYQGNLYDTETYSLIVQEIHTTATLVAVPANRLNKFLRDFPTARPVRDVAREACAVWRASLTDDVRLAMKFQRERYSEISRVRCLEVDKIADPAFAAYLALADTDVADDKLAYGTFNNMAAGVHDILGDSVKLPKNPMYNYGLKGGQRYDSVPTSMIEHYTLYVNAVYAARQAGAKI